MDVASSALTKAWLQAVVRIQSERTQPAPVPQAERTLTDVIERALRHGHVATQKPDPIDPMRPGATLDRLV
jgi:hypothetical protein